MTALQQAQSAGVPTRDAMRAAQKAWAGMQVRERLRVLRHFRAELAAGARELAATIPTSFPGSLHRNVLPVALPGGGLAGYGAWVLRWGGYGGGAFFTRTVDVEVERAPLGTVLLIGPGNYPLFLPGAQCLQALAAGNAVIWKPAPAGLACAHAMRVMLIASGLPPELLAVLEPSTEAAEEAMEAGVDKVFLTGSAATGEAVLRRLAGSATPAVMELSGCDAVFVLPGADLDRAAEALAFGLRLNGSATCMAPRRVFAAQPIAEALEAKLGAALSGLPPVPVPQGTRDRLRDLIAEAQFLGARTVVDGLVPPIESAGVGATLLARVRPEMRAAREDIFAPVLSLLTFRSIAEAVAMHEECPYALTAAVFGPEKQARALAGQITAGTVLLNDIVVPTADPRVPFSGRKRSGFGATRGREGLLEMTYPRAIANQRSRSRMPYRPTGPAHAELFAGYTELMHGRGRRKRLEGLRRMMGALPGLRPR